MSTETPTLPETSHVRDLREALAPYDRPLTFERNKGSAGTTVWKAGSVSITFNRRGYVTGWSVSGCFASVGGRWGYKSGREALDSLLGYIARNRHPSYSGAPLFRV